MGHGFNITDETLDIFEVLSKGKYLDASEQFEGYLNNTKGQNM